MSNAESKSIFTYKTLVHAVAGAVGSVVAMGTFYPLDTVRSRLQLEENRESKNTVAVIQELVAEEGFHTLYRGMVPVLQSLCTSNFVYFYTFHGLKSMNGKSGEQNAARDLMLASAAGVINVMTTTPLWVVNTRLKMKGVPIKDGKQKVNFQPETEDQQYSGIIDGIIKIAHTEGIKKLWSGVCPSLLLVSNPAIQFMTYEAIKRRLVETYGKKNLSSMIFFFVGAISKAVATIITYPLQLIQAKLRHGHSYSDLSPDAGTWELISYIVKKYGIRGLYKGMEAKILQTIFTAALMFAAYEKIAAFVFKILLSNSKMKHNG